MEFSRSDFYVTTNQQTFAHLGDGEIEVQPALMDSAIVVDRAAKTATATKFYGVKKGMEVVVGHQGIRVVPLQRSTARADSFRVHVEQCLDRETEDRQ